MLADRGEGSCLGRGKALRTQPVAGDERTMHKQIGIAADRRGEMSIAPERQAEMAEIVRAVDGLSLAAQDQLMDQGLVRRAGGLAQDLVEMARAHRLAFGELEAGDAEAVEE